MTRAIRRRLYRFCLGVAASIKTFRWKDDDVVTSTPLKFPAMAATAEEDLHVVETPRFNHTPFYWLVIDLIRQFFPVIYGGDGLGLDVMGEE